MFFYKGKSKNPPSQALTVVGIFEDYSIAKSTQSLMRLTGGISVYSESELIEWKASSTRPVKVINYLLAGYIDPPISLDDLRAYGAISNHPPQSIFEINRRKFVRIAPHLNFGFEI